MVSCDGQSAKQGGNVDDNDDGWDECQYQNSTSTEAADWKGADANDWVCTLFFNICSNMT